MNVQRIVWRAKVQWRRKRKKEKKVFLESDGVMSITQLVQGYIT